MITIIDIVIAMNYLCRGITAGRGNGDCLQLERAAGRAEVEQAALARRGIAWS